MFAACITDRRREDNQPGRGRVKLAISHMSQQDTTASQRGDCGPTCLAMMINVQRATPLTIDEMYRDTAVLKPKIGKSGPQSYTSWWEMGEVAKAYGLATDQPTYQTAEIALAELRRHVRNGTPLVALVNYGRWTDLPDIAENRFDGPHFVLVTGVDEEYVFIHDPLFTFARRQKGTHFPLSNARFLDAWGNLSRQTLTLPLVVPKDQGRLPFAKRLFLLADIGFGLVHTLDMGPASDALEAGAWPLHELPFADMPARFGYRLKPQP